MQVKTLDDVALEIGALAEAVKTRRAGKALNNAVKRAQGPALSVTAAISASLVSAAAHENEIDPLAALLAVDDLSAFGEDCLPASAYGIEDSHDHDAYAINGAHGHGGAFYLADPFASRFENVYAREHDGHDHHAQSHRVSDSGHTDHNAAAGSHPGVQHHASHSGAAHHAAAGTGAHAQHDRASGSTDGDHGTHSPSDAEHGAGRAGAGGHAAHSQPASGGAHAAHQPEAAAEPAAPVQHASVDDQDGAESALIDAMTDVIDVLAPDAIPLMNAAAPAAAPEHTSAEHHPFGPTLAEMDMPTPEDLSAAVHSHI